MVASADQDEPNGLYRAHSAIGQGGDMEKVPDTRRVRASRVQNVDTDRLVRRAAFLRTNLPELVTGVGPCGIWLVRFSQLRWSLKKEGRIAYDMLLPTCVKMTARRRKGKIQWSSSR